MADFNKASTRLTLAAILLCGIGTAWADGTTTPGKASVFVSKSGVTVPTTTGPLVPDVSGTIQKGKKKQVLEIDLTLTDGGNTSSVLGVVPIVNGFSDVVQPSALSQLSECAAASWFDCTVSGHFWVDLDAAETAHVGMFIKQPLVIDMQGGSNVAVTAGIASLRAHLQKK
jgi:hypothetical protein